MATMQAVTLRAHGGPGVLRLEELPVPTPGPGEVRVKIAAVALNHLDVWVRKGGPAFHLDFPHRLGADLVGTIDALGAGVGDLEVGARTVVQPGLSCGRCAACIAGDDNLCRQYRILGEHAQGGYGEYLCVPRVNLAPYPANLAWAEAASGILTFLTAWQMVVRKARVEPGQTVLVQGGGSGVGVAAIQIAKLYGARVFTTVGSDAKVAPARALGADEVINYRQADFAAAVKQLTAKRGVDAVIDHVGGEVLASSIRSVRVGGRVVTCGATAGFHPAIDLRHIFFRQVELLGSTMGRKADLLAVLDHLAAGRLRPVVHAVLPLAAAARGHELLEERAVFGKVVLAVDPSVPLTASP
ncbi:MAG TPA: zinc-binding dehydrogenase [Kofleriaceae bacterium]|nr:zinc-binding dehydrogenase [Kofleriaceae bacterium]